VSKTRNQSGPKKQEPLTGHKKEPKQIVANENEEEKAKKNATKRSEEVRFALRRNFPPLLKGRLPVRDERKREDQKELEDFRKID